MSSLFFQMLLFFLVYVNMDSIVVVIILQSEPWFGLKLGLTTSIRITNYI